MKSTSIFIGKTLFSILQTYLTYNTFIEPLLINHDQVILVLFNYFFDTYNVSELLLFSVCREKLPVCLKKFISIVILFFFGLNF